VQLLGSGSILTEALKAQQILARKVQCRGRSLERHQLQRTAARGVEGRSLEPLHPAEPAKTPYVQQVLEGGTEGPDHRGVRLHEGGAGSDRPVAAGRYLALGTDGFGRSDNREHLRAHFEVNAASIAGAALSKVGARRQVRREEGREGACDLGLDPEKADAATA
jgi:pyruvate dehydrogenase E1 component